jgi:hypothetical protein
MPSILLRRQFAPQKLQRVLQRSVDFAEARPEPTALQMIRLID